MAFAPLFFPARSGEGLFAAIRLGVLRKRFVGCVAFPRKVDHQGILHGVYPIEFCIDNEPVL